MPFFSTVLLFPYASLSRTFGSLQLELYKYSWDILGVEEKKHTLRKIHLNAQTSARNKRIKLFRLWWSFFFTGITPTLCSSLKDHRIVLFVFGGHFFRNEEMNETFFCVIFQPSLLKCHLKYCNSITTLSIHHAHFPSLVWFEAISFFY